MSYRRTWSKTFKSTEFKDPEVSWPNVAPDRCPEHPGRCLRAINEWTWAATIGLWKLRTPIDVQSVMPGTKQKILSLNTLGLYLNYSAWWVTAQSDIILYGDGAEIYRYNSLSRGNNIWVANPLEVNKMIDNISKLDVGLYQVVDVNSGTLAFHDADITLSCEYYTTVPPSKGDLEVLVIDAQKRTPLRNINVRVMSGTRVIREGYTGADGKAKFTSVDEGSYILTVAGVPPTYWSGGYQGLDLEIEVAPNVLNSFTAELPPLAAIPIPWYAWAGLGVVAVGGTLYYFRRPIAPAVTIIREEVRHLRKGYGAEEE